MFIDNISEYNLSFLILHLIIHVTKDFLILCSSFVVRNKYRQITLTVKPGTVYIKSSPYSN